MDRRRPRGRVACVAAGMLVVLAGCTSDDGDDPEVAGAVLERDDNGEVTGPDVDDTREDPRDGPGARDDAAFADDEDGGAEPEPVEDGSEDENAEVSQNASDPSTPAPPAASPMPTPDPNPAPAEPAPAQPDSAQPAPERPVPSAPVPPAAPAPSPVSLPAGPGELGAFLGFGEGGVELAGVGPIESGAGAGVVVDVLRTDDGRARCEATVRAAQDRPLSAAGILRVDLVLQTRDGTERRIPRQVLDLDVALPAGDTAALPRSPATAIDPETLTEVRCTTDFQPA